MGVAGNERDKERPLQGFSYHHPDCGSQW